MGNTITALTTSFSSATLWGEVEGVVPFITVTTLFALGFYLVRRALKKVKKANGGI